MPRSGLTRLFLLSIAATLMLGACNVPRSVPSGAADFNSTEELVDFDWDGPSGARNAASNAHTAAKGRYTVKDYNVDVFGSQAAYEKMRDLANRGDPYALWKMYNYFNQHPDGDNPEVRREMIRFMAIDARRNGDCYSIDTLSSMYEFWGKFDIESIIGVDELARLERLHHCREKAKQEIDNITARVH